MRPSSHLNNNCIVYITCLLINFNVHIHFNDSFLFTIADIKVQGYNYLWPQEYKQLSYSGLKGICSKDNNYFSLFFLIHRTSSVYEFTKFPLMKWIHFSTIGDDVYFD